MLLTVDSCKFNGAICRGLRIVWTIRGNENPWMRRFSVLARIDTPFESVCFFPKH